MNEGQVKAAVLTRVREAAGRRRKPIVTAEFTLGSSGVRADLAVFAETSIGFEIKTARDTLRRLPAQMAAYARYFDHAVAIVAPCHVPNIAPDALHGGSLWTYDECGTLQTLVEGKVNIVATEALIDLMTQAERRRGDFGTAVAARYDATSRQFWAAVSRRSIRSADLPLLSRFTEARTQARQLADEREAYWSRWMAAQNGLSLASA
ncbi:sce7726 family protein [Sphingomonas hankookensis]|uniref:sce7726 family protein n=1 Tax=Sphingomonas hankookensis TaxID=563996 RepID=UPI0026C85274